MFEFPHVENAVSYTLLISYDSLQNDLNSNYLIKQKEKMPILRVSGLPLGKKYVWQIVTELKSGKTVVSEKHFFSILSTEFANKNKYQITQTYNKKNKIQNGLIWVDHFHCALDRDGNIVWFIPNSSPDFETKRQIRDFKFYNNGSLTFISAPEAYHVDLNMNVIWKASNTNKIADTKIGDYHHDLEILKNGNYLVMANEVVNFENDLPNDTIVSAPVDFTNLVEFNKNGEIAWTWIMKEHFPYEFLINSKIEKESGVVNPHANSFCIDEKNNFIYISFRDISRIIKIDKATKKIVTSYGLKLNNEDDVIETDLFRLQHDIQLTSNNDFLLFNNNDIKKKKVSSVEIINQVNEQNKEVQSKWNFKLNFDTINNGMALKMGGVKMLPNTNLLICEGTLNRVVEISKNKEVLWDLVIEKKDSLGRKNSSFPIYRADFSTSLYPYYFSIVKDENKLIIFNKGDNSDSYKIKMTNKVTGVVSEKKTEVIKVNKVKKMVLALDEKNNYSVEVISESTGQSRWINF